MGRKLQGAALRAKKRATVAAKEMEDTTAVVAETIHVTSKSDDQLFVLDTTAILPSKKKQQQLDKASLKIQKEKKKGTPSAKEQAQIEKLRDTHAPESLQALVKQGQLRTTKRARKGVVRPNFDLWGAAPAQDDQQQQQQPLAKKLKPAPTTVGSTNAIPGIGMSLAGIRPDNFKQKTLMALQPTYQKGVVRIDVAKGGQSYNPDPESHSKIMQDAFQVEMKRKKAEEYRSAPVSAGMSEETKALLLGDSSDEEDSGDEKDKEDGDDNDGPVGKKKDKLTRAQRNKQKRVREEQREIDERKRNKKIQGQVGEAKTLGKKLRKELIEKQKQKEELDILKEARMRVKGKNVFTHLGDENPIYAPTLPVALPSELRKRGGSLRTMKPKGSLLTDRLTSLMDRDMAPKKALKRKMRVQGKRRKVKVRGKGFDTSKEGAILG
jgi:nucleolar protein 53